MLAGHSQGCQSIAVLGAVDPRVRGVLLSGCGGDVRLGVLYRRDRKRAFWAGYLTCGGTSLLLNFATDSSKLPR